MTEKVDAPPCLSPEGAASQVEAAFELLGGRWKMIIIFHLFAVPIMRFSELERAIAGVSQKMLAQQLRELERDGLLSRTLHAEVPPRVEYRLTKIGEALRPALQAIREWINNRELYGDDARPPVPLGLPAR